MNKDIGYFFTYLKRLHHFAGIKLYLNLFAMAVIGLVDSIGIYLLVPLLGLIGILNVQAEGIPFVSDLNMALDQFSLQNRLYFVLLAYIVLLLCQALLQRYQTNLNMRIQQGFIGVLRVETYEALMRANWSFFLQKRKSDFSHTMTSELARVSQGVYMVLSLGTTLLFTVIQIGVAFWLSVPLTVSILVCGLLLALFSRRFLKKSRRLGARTTELSQSYMGGLAEHFNGIKDIKSNRLEKQHINWFQALSQQMEMNMVQFARVQSNSQFFYKATSAVLVALFVFLSFKVFSVQGEQLIIIVLIFSRLWPRFTSLQSSGEQIISTIPAFKNLSGLIQSCRHAAESRDIENNGQAIRIQQGIECNQVYYRYGENESSYALQNINLHIPANGMTAIVGKSGAGKSTLIDLLIGLLEPNQGEVMVDGIPLKDEQRLALRNTVGYVSQEPFLFHSSIRENLLVAAPGASDKQLWEALRFSASDEFVSALPEGLDTVLGDRGVRLSGGERQRIVLARAILRKPSLLILDEATSALDAENEAKIKHSIERLKGQMTIIVIAHRLSTIRDADQVIVLEEGKIIQQGGYQQLSKDSKGTFSRLLAYQMEVNFSL